MNTNKTIVNKFEQMIEPAKIRAKLIFFSSILISMQYFNIDIEKFSFSGIQFTTINAETVKIAISVIITYYNLLLQYTLLLYICKRLSLKLFEYSFIDNIYLISIGYIIPIMIGFFSISWFSQNSERNLSVLGICIQMILYCMFSSIFIISIITRPTYYNHCKDHLISTLVFLNIIFVLIIINQAFNTDKLLIFYNKDLSWNSFYFIIYYSNFALISLFALLFIFCTVIVAMSLLFMILYLTYKASHITAKFILTSIINVRKIKPYYSTSIPKSLSKWGRVVLSLTCFISIYITLINSLLSYMISDNLKTECTYIFYQFLKQ